MQANHKEKLTAAFQTLKKPKQVKLHALGAFLQELGQNDQRYAGFITTLYWAVGQLILPTHKLKGSDIAGKAAMGELSNIVIDVKLDTDTVMTFRVYQEVEDNELFVGSITATVTYDSEGPNLWKNANYGDVKIVNA